MTDAKQVEQALQDIAVLLSSSPGGRFKAQAYERGAEVVEGLAFELGNVIAAGRLTEIEGIGPSLSKQILELWSSGSSRLLEKLRAEHPPGAAALLRVPGLTPKRIKVLSEGLGIATVEALRTACHEHKLRDLPGFGIKTEQKLRETLDQLDQLAQQTPVERRILLPDALALAETLEAALRSDARVVGCRLAGAARRGEETLSELALVVLLADEHALQADQARLLERLARLPFVLRVDASGGLLQLTEGITLRLHVTHAGAEGGVLVEATGPAPHLDALRARALARGVSLEQASESALYRALGLHVVPPELRSTPAALAQAEHDDFSDLISESDIRGMVHCHTTHSDGRNSIEEMARAAAQLGMQYITITDHSPSAHYAHGVTLERLEAQWEEIREAEQRVGIRILRGTESDILADGSLDYPPDVLVRFDVVIASIHARHKMNREQMTTRLVNAMKQPVFKIWGHALGRLLLSREPIDCDVEAVLDALAASRGAIEINGDPHRLDLPPEWIPKARERGIPFVLSVDAHSTKGLGVLPFAAQMARRGGLRRAEVLNTLPPDAFLAHVQAG